MCVFRCRSRNHQLRNLDFDVFISLQESKLPAQKLLVELFKKLDNASKISRDGFKLETVFPGIGQSELFAKHPVREAFQAKFLMCIFFCSKYLLIFRNCRNLITSRAETRNEAKTSAETSTETNAETRNEAKTNKR
jgi:hypothetical protein